MVSHSIWWAAGRLTLVVELVVVNGTVKTEALRPQNIKDRQSKRHLGCMSEVVRSLRFRLDILWNNETVEGTQRTGCEPLYTSVALSLLHSHIIVCRDKTMIRCLGDKSKQRRRQYLRHEIGYPDNGTAGSMTIGIITASIRSR